MKLKDILIVDTALFIVIALVHLLRLLLQTPIKVGDFSIPLWVSAAAVVLLFFLAMQNWISMPKKTTKTLAKIVAIIFAVDALFGVSAWFYGVEFLGFSGNLYLAGIVFDLIVIGVLWWYIKKK